jgi:hypothetical protein
MKTHHKTPHSLWALLALAGLCSLPPAAMADIRIGGSSFAANGQPAPVVHSKRGYQYTGSCPVDLKFDWGVVSTDPVDMVYSFSRNDGGQSQPSQASLPGGEQSFPIEDGWSLGANVDQFAEYRGWVQLNIQSPYPLTYRIPFTIHCVAPDAAADQTAGADAAPAGDAPAASDALVASDSDGVQAPDPPPALPDPDQPPCPQDGELWTPGYWGYGPAGGYFWVPGTWVAPPQVGLLWTPGYWGFAGGRYAWRAGYWGNHVGFYGGVNYGFGYGGHGFFGGRWQGGRFSYNTAITRVSTTIIHNTYRETVVNNTTINNVTVNRTSFNGGPRGIVATPTAEDKLALTDTHFKSSAQQMSHFNLASKNPTLYAKANGGHPSITSTVRPASFNSPGAIHGGAAMGGAQVKSVGKPMIDPIRPPAPHPDVATTSGHGASPAQAVTKAAVPHSNTVVRSTNPPPTRPVSHVATALPTNSTASHVASSPPKVTPAVHTASLPQHPAAPVHTAPPPPHPAAQPSHPAAPAQPQKKEPPPKK